MPLTFVSAFIDLHENRETSEKIGARFRWFKKLVSRGINIHLFLSKSYKEYYDSIVKHRGNVFVEYIELEDLDTYKELQGLTYSVPETNTFRSRSVSKDTVNFHIVNNAKVELVYMAIQNDHFKSENYAWIDFSIARIFRKLSTSLDYLYEAHLNDSLFLTDIHIPGCWYSYYDYSRHDLFVEISWRFCGGFFIGNKESLLKFYQLYRSHFRETTQEKKVLTWETNIWHHFEMHKGFSPVWYLGDHDDTIIKFL